jgi:hypothetical protein
MEQQRRAEAEEAERDRERDRERDDAERRRREAVRRRRRPSVRCGANDGLCLSVGRRWRAGGSDVVCLKVRNGADVSVFPANVACCRDYGKPCLEGLVAGREAVDGTAPGPNGLLSELPGNYRGWNWAGVGLGSGAVMSWIPIAPNPLSPLPCEREWSVEREYGAR